MITIERLTTVIADGSLVAEPGMLDMQVMPEITVPVTPGHGHGSDSEAAVHALLDHLIEVEDVDLTLMLDGDTAFAATGPTGAEGGFTRITFYVPIGLSDGDWALLDALVDRELGP